MSGIPKHIAIVCDGNRRWAKRQGLLATFGHRRAVDAVFEPLILHAQEKGVEFLTFWIFSTENWKRDKKEVAFLLDLFRDFFDTKIDKLSSQNVRIKMIGDRSGFPRDIQDRIAAAEEKTQHNTGITIVTAMNYGGRDELSRAVNDLIARREQEQVTGAVTPKDIEAHLDTRDIPDPELLVRTSGEQRLSGFLLWQCEYSEFYFPEWDFPEFTPQRLDECLAEFTKRRRRFGGG